MCVRACVCVHVCACMCLCVCVGGGGGGGEREGIGCLIYKEPCVLSVLNNPKGKYTSKPNP